MGLAKLVDAPVLLAGDIDRGGVFAQLYGTVALLEQEERARIAGTGHQQVPRRRGDSAARPGDAGGKARACRFWALCRICTVEIEDEDPPFRTADCEPRGRSRWISAVIRLPRISNFTDFIAAGAASELLGVRYVQRARELGRPDLVILPGTKNTMEDLLWLRQNGLEAAVLKLAARGHAGTRRMRRLPDAGADA